MSAPQHKGVDVRLDERSQILTRDETCGVMLDPAFFDERREKRTGARSDADVRIEAADGLLVGAGLDRAGGTDDADVPAARRLYGGPRARLDDADDRHVERRAQAVERMRGRRVTGDDHALHSFVAKKGGDLSAV